VKIIRRLLIFIVILGAIGFGVYHFGLKIASEKLMDYYVAELSSSPVLKEVKEKIQNHPDILQFVEAGGNIDESILPFTTKEEAAKELISKFGFSEIIDIAQTVSNGITEDEQINLLNEIENKLTDEEILALQVIAYKELNQ
jgi:hypothetical protein